MKRKNREFFEFNLSKLVLILLLAGWLTPAHLAAQVAVPFSQDFSSGSGGFSTGAQVASSDSDTWSVVPSGDSSVFQDSATVAYTGYQYSSCYASVQVSNLGGGVASNFVESVDVTVTTCTPYHQNVSLVALGNHPSFGIYAGDTYYLASFHIGGSDLIGRFSIQYSDGTGYPAELTNTQFSGQARLNTKYHLVFTGTYDANGNLTLTSSVSDGTNTTTISAPQIAAGTAKLLTGHYFGLLDNYTSGSTGKVVVQYGNYKLNDTAQPEACLTASSLTRSNMCLSYAGEPVTVRFNATGVTNGWSLKVLANDEHGAQVFSNSYPINATGNWTNDVVMPSSRLGFYRVFGSLWSGTNFQAELSAVGSRPAGFMTYCVVPDPRQRQLYPESQSFFGMQGGFNPAAGTDLLAFLGVRWSNNGGWNWNSLSPNYANPFNAATSPLPERQADWATDAKGGKWLVYNIPNLTVNGRPYGGNPDVYKANTFSYNTGALKPEYYADWSNFCAQVAIAWPTVYPERKQPIYEITWEPMPEWGYLGSNADLVTMYQLAHDAIHAHSTNALVVGPCMGINSDAAIGQNLALFDLTPGPGLLSYIDGFSAHTYMDFDIAISQTPFADPEVVGQPGLISTIKQRIHQRLGHSIPMFGTEQGYRTRNNVGWELDQARRLVRDNLMMLGEGWRLNLAFYPADYPTTDTLDHTSYWDWGFFYNLATKDFGGYGPGRISPKPVVAAYSAMTFLLEGHKSDGPINWLGDWARGYAYEDYATGNDVILALWDFGSTGSTVKIDTGVTSVTVYDWMGNATITPTVKGQLTLNLGPEVTYVRGVSPALWGSRRPNLNVALGKNVTVSSTDPVNYPEQTGAMAVDGDSESGFSRWVSASDYSIDKWIVVDLGAPCTIDTVRFWTGQYLDGWHNNNYQIPLKNYQIQYWDTSKSTWVTEVSDSANSKAVVVAKFPTPVTTTKIRLYTPAWLGPQQVHLYELEALVPPPVPSPALTIQLAATNKATISWPSPSTGYSLLETTNLPSTNWVTPSEPVTDDGTNKSLIVQPTTTPRYYQLRTP